MLQQRRPRSKNSISEADENMNSDMNSNYMEDYNNSPSTSVLKKRNKSSLNVETDDLPSVDGSSPDQRDCPGLATSAVTYKLD